MTESVSNPPASAGSTVTGTDLQRTRRHKTNGHAQSAVVDRLPPHSVEAEKGVLGCQLLSPNECVGEVIEKLKEDGVNAHYDLRHQVIQKELFEMFNARLPIDLITIQQRLKDKQLLEQIGGIVYLSQLQDSVPSSANLGYYLQIVREKYLLRRLIQTCTGVVGRIYDFEGDVEQLLDEVEKDILHVNESR